jgi:hydrogenase maturation protease
LVFLSSFGLDLSIEWEHSEYRIPNAEFSTSISLSINLRLWHDRPMTSIKPVRILGVGNVLCTDDGLGPYAIKVLESSYVFPDGVEVIDLGTPGMDLTPYLADARMIIVIDTVRGDEAPGTVRLLRDREIVSAPPPSRMSPHEPGLREALMATEFSDSSPDEILFVGVIPASTEQGTSLTPSLMEAVPAVVDAVIQELNRLEMPATRRDPPAELDIWWE